MEPWIPGAITGTLSIIVVVFTGWLQSRRERSAHTRASASPGAPTVQEIWKRQDTMENAFKASLVLLGELAEQWDGPHPPVLSKRAIETLRSSDFLPTEFDRFLKEE